MQSGILAIPQSLLTKLDALARLPVAEVKRLSAKLFAEDIDEPKRNQAVKIRWWSKREDSIWKNEG